MSRRPCPTSRAATTTMRWRAACCCVPSATRSMPCRPMCWMPKPCNAWRRAHWPHWKPPWRKRRPDERRAGPPQASERPLGGQRGHAVPSVGADMTSYFVTGTDTGVGKTLVAAAMLHALAKRYPRVVGMKPVAAGHVRVGECWTSEDALALRAASTVQVASELDNPILLPDPLSPHIAAQRVGA